MYVAAPTVLSTRTFPIPAATIYGLANVAPDVMMTEIPVPDGFMKLEIVDIRTRLVVPPCTITN
jgi:hypothetical protein